MEVPKDGTTTAPGHATAPFPASPRAHVKAQEPKPFLLLLPADLNRETDVETSNGTARKDVPAKGVEVEALRHVTQEHIPYKNSMREKRMSSTEDGRKQCGGDTVVERDSSKRACPTNGGQEDHCETHLEQPETALACATLFVHTNHYHNVHKHMQRMIDSPTDLLNTPPSNQYRGEGAWSWRRLHTVG